MDKFWYWDVFIDGDTPTRDEDAPIRDEDEKEEDSEEDKGTYWIDEEVGCTVIDGSFEILGDNIDSDRSWPLYRWWGWFFE